MKRFRAGAALLSLCTLAGCGLFSDDDLQNESGSAVAVKIRKVASAGNFVKPGRWETKIALDQVVAPGMAPEFIAKLKASMRQPQGASSCLTAEDVKRGAFYVGEENAACRYEHFAMKAGRIEGRLRCADSAGTRSMAMAGTYTPDTYHLVVSTDSQSAAQPGAAGRVSVTMTMDARRTGVCIGNEGRALRRF